MDKMEKNKSIDRLTPQKNLCNALVEAYKADKDILETYGDIVTFKRRQDDHDEDEEPSVGLNRGSKRRRAGKEPKSTNALKERTTTGKSTEGSKSHHKSAGQSAQAVEPMHTAKYLEEPTHQELPSPDRDWKETLPTNHGPVQPWLNVDTLTPKLLVGLTFELMKGTCRSLIKLEYFFEEVYKATMEKLDWNNPEGHQYPHDLRKPLPLISNSRGHYGHIKWIEELVPNIMSSQITINFDKCALWGISHWGHKRQQFYGFAANRESAHDVYFRRRIIAVTKLQTI
ncbi:hypothetical protein Tco_1058974 [Tanacetum coccineum]